MSGPDAVALADNLRRLELFYGPRLAEHGTTHKAVGWLRPESQRVRFENLAVVAGLDGHRVREDRRPAVGGGPQPDHVGGERHRPVEAVGGAVLERDVDAHGSDSTSSRWKKISERRSCRAPRWTCSSSR